MLQEVGGLLLLYSADSGGIRPSDAARVDDFVFLNVAKKNIKVPPVQDISDVTRNSSAERSCPPAALSTSSCFLLCAQPSASRIIAN